MVNTQGLGLEIGPSHAPVFPKCEGFRVKVFDHVSADLLRVKYAGHNVDIAAIEDVDYVSDSRSMHEVIGDEEKFDYIFSSHVIEHVPDLLGYFKSCEKLLKPDGVVVLAVPDRRYIFDVFLPITTTGEVLQAHREGRHRHSPAQVFDFYANFATLEGRVAWNEAASGKVDLVDTLANADSWYVKASRPGHDYIDVHGWRFTPSSFRLILRDAQELGILRLREVALIEAGDYEFYTSYSLAAEGLARTRIEILRDIQREVARGCVHVLEPFDT